MAFGDGLNDLTMLQTAAVGVAMGNAAPRVKKLTNYITDTNDNDGVAKAIRFSALMKMNNRKRMPKKGIRFRL